ncbi:MAG: trypsin-like serine protease [Pseudomonadota bacterium]
MVTTVTHYSDPRNRAYPGEGYDGVVRISVGGKSGTGVLLYDGKAILTVAHLFSQSSLTASILFETTKGTQTLSSDKVTIHPNYDAINENNDLALVWLSAAAPVAAERYTLYRNSDETGQTMTLVGYGTPGTGSSGTFANNGSILRLKANNQFDADIGTLKNSLGAAMGWIPLAGTQLVADFDDGTISHDAVGNLINRSGLGLGNNEGLIAPGDSGGPAFINGQVTGVASYTASLGLGNINPDIDSLSNSSYGEIAAWQRVSVFQQWIDQNLRAQYPNVPAKPEEVQKQIGEGNSGTSYTYFLLQFTGMRSDLNQLLSVEYATRDGTANAGSDYLAVQGKLVLYPNESQAVIPVEIIGDTVSESNETFYLDVVNPVGGNFAEEAVKLTAMRTILNDDGIIWS